MRGYTLEIAPAPMYYIFMAFQVMEIIGSVCVIVSSYLSKKDMPDRLNLQIILLFSMLSPAILLSLRLLGILEWDAPDTARNVFRLRVYVYCRRQIQNDRPGKKRKKPDHPEFE